MEVFFASHGELAAGMESALNVIFDNNIPVAIKAFGLKAGDNVDDLFDNIYNELNPSIQTIILTDMIGGSVDNALFKLANKENVTIITGMNLPLALQVVLAASAGIEVDFTKIVSEAKAGIIDKKELIKEINIDDDL